MAEALEELGIVLNEVGAIRLSTDQGRGTQDTPGDAPIKPVAIDPQRLGESMDRPADIPHPSHT